MQLTPARLARLSPHVALSLAFAVSRLSLYWLGLRFNLILDWMFLSDPSWLRQRLLETVYYFHAYPPGMNLLTGLLLKLSPDHVAGLAELVFFGFGLLLVNSLLYLCRVSGLRPGVAFGVTLAFSLIPQSIYFEKLYLYTCPIAALLCSATALFHAALRAPSFGKWLGLYGICCAICYTRSAFHLLWFLVMLALGLAFTGVGGRKRVLGAALAPGILVGALYLKNLILFDVLGATSFAPSGLSLVTVYQMPAEQRNAWIREGKLSPFAGISVYVGYPAFVNYVENDRSGLPPVLGEPLRPTVHADNLNHWTLLEVNRRRLDDALYYIEHRPRAYAATVIEGLKDFFTASTEWHPRDRRAGSPHYEHRKVLGTYERLYNRVVHGFPSPVGIYAWVPLVFGWSLWRARRLLRTKDARAHAQGALIAVSAVQISYVVAVSTLFTFRESARYRYQIEALLWLLTSLSLASLWRSLRARRTRLLKRAASA